MFLTVQLQWSLYFLYIYVVHINNIKLLAASGLKAIQRHTKGSNHKMAINYTNPLNRNFIIFRPVLLCIISNPYIEWSMWHFHLCEFHCAGRVVRHVVTSGSINYNIWCCDRLRGLYIYPSFVKISPLFQEFNCWDTQMYKYNNLWLFWETVGRVAQSV